MSGPWAVFEKDPDAVLDYQIDWSNWLPTGDTIDNASWTVESGITEESNTSTATTATIWLSGGTVGEEYDLTNRIVTTAGRTDDRTIRIHVAGK